MNAFPSQWQLHAAARWIRAGGVIACPAEAVFDLGRDPGTGRAVERLPPLKHRLPANGLILVAPDWRQLQPWLASAPDVRHERLRDCLCLTWPAWLTDTTHGDPRSHNRNRGSQLIQPMDYS